MLEILSSGGIAAPAHYLHWDDLGEAVAPSLLNQREWWLALKLERLPGRVSVGLQDCQENPHTLAPANLFLPALHRLDLGPAADGLPGSVHPGGEWHDYFTARAQVDEAIASARLAGAELTDDAAREMLARGRRPRSEGERAAANLHEALEFLREGAAQPLSLGLLAELHERILADLGGRPGAAGRLRRPGEIVARAAGPPGPDGEAPPAGELPARVKAMLAFANARAPATFVHPFARACALHHWVRHDRPFAAGNGRLARLLFQWAVRHHGYRALAAVPLSREWAENPAALALAFARVASDENDLNHLTAHHLAALARALRRLRDEVRGHEEAVAGAAARSRTMAPDLNPRQHALLADALREPAASHTLQSHARAHRLVRQTARHDFAPLVRLGLFEETKSGKTLLYQPAPGLADRLDPAPAGGGSV